MNSLMVLLQAEFKRLAKYNIIQVSLGVTVLWLAVLFLIGQNEAGAFIPLFIFMDVSLMTMLLIGAGLFYERQENTLKTLMVTPASTAGIIASKIVSAVYIALQSTILIALAGHFFFDATINFFALIPLVVLVAISHAVIGYLVAMYVKDFTSMLAMLMLYMFVFAFPSIFYAIDMIGGVWETLLIVSPSHAAMILIDFSFGAEETMTLVVVGVVYLSLLSILLMRFFVYPKYIETAIKE